MSIKIWEGIDSTKNDEEDQLYYRFEATQHKDVVVLCVVGKDGKVIKDGNLMLFDVDDRCITLLEGISKDIPLKTSIRGELLTVTQSEMRAIHKEQIDRKMNRLLSEAALDHERESVPCH